ncbi:hypothetical protein CNMCM5793_005599 [Aspergillus hiratsukae]|uniref:Uncharacterized protein n=1 Tax=Aspergillus hiratsukae TaxID=1194566 RepID=A0A8H6UJH4_9EURO|nr:hypothetical protein CNMCM5793_005599 [Aspergillus hiratsukae]KAF7171841.1 hypothetical protein CNMCM6106_006179 [Aspergillus hiratsukae]
MIRPVTATKTSYAPKHEFRHEGVPLPISIAKFGDLANAGPYSFVVDAGAVARDSDIQSAITVKLKSTGTFLVTFAAPVRGLGNTLEIGEGKKITRPIAREGAKSRDVPTWEDAMAEVGLTGQTVHGAELASASEIEYKQFLLLRVLWVPG